MAGMLKFTCEQCGHRIATPPRRLGQLVTCPECGHATHPLAAQILSHRAEPSSPAKDQDQTGKGRGTGERTCANCGQAIGRLQKLQLWDNDVVCTTCHRALANESSRVGMIVEGTLPAPAASRPTAKKRRGGVAPVASVLPRQANETALAVHTEVIDVPATPFAGGSANALPYAAAWRAAPLTARGRMMLVLGAFCFLAAAVYGALTLLRDLAGIIATIAFLLLGIACVYLLARASLAAGKRLLDARAAGRK